MVRAMAPRPRQPAERPPWTARATAALLVVSVVAAVVGAGLVWLVWPAGGVRDIDRARFFLRTDTGAGLHRAADLADGNPDLMGIAALARLLLWRDHGGDEAVLAAALKALQKASSSARLSPEGLYARALLVTDDDRSRDARLQTDLKDAADASPWVLLSRARLAEQQHTDDDTDAASPLAQYERAALTTEPLPYATHELARAAARSGDVPFARAALARLATLSPEHPGAAITAAVLDVVDGTATSADDNVRATFKAHLARLTDLAGSVDEGDAALLRLTRAALETAPLPAWEKVVEHASADVVEQALEATLVHGDIATAEAVAAHAPAKAPVDIAADLARLHVLRALPEARRSAAIAAITANRSKTKENPPGVLPLPLGELRADFARHPLPFVTFPSPLLFPERRLQRLLADANADAKTLAPRLAALEQLALVDHALTVDDLAATTAPLKAARDAMGGTPDVLLVEAAVFARRGNVADARKSLDAAVLAAPLDPDVLLQAAQKLLALDDVSGARRALQAFARLGLSSPTASALTACLAVSSGDLGSARAALAEAKHLGGDDDVEVLRATVLAHRTTTIAAARAAADKLLARNDVDGGRIVTAWIADAAWRAGDQAKATALLAPLLAAVLSSSSNDFPELHFFFAQTIAFVPQQRSMALAEAAKAAKGLVGSELLPEVKTLQALLQKKPT
jgi:hypothetical protein